MAGKSLGVCILGGTGFVGTELVMHLAAAGHSIRVPTRNLSRGNHLKVLPTVELVAANVHDGRVLGQLFEGMDVVINLIGIVNERRRETFRGVHAELAGKVVEAMRAARVHRLLHMSALGAGAQAPSQYLRSKSEAEAQVRVAAAWLDATIFRPSVIFGPNDTLSNRFARLLRLSHGVLPLARPRARFAPIWIEDVVAAFIRALGDRRTGGKSYELCGPEVMTLAELVRAVGVAAGLPCHIIPLPDFIAQIQGVFMDFLPGKPFTYDNYKSLTIDSVCAQNGCASLGIHPTPMRGVIAGFLQDHSTRRLLDFYRKSSSG